MPLFQKEEEAAAGSQSDADLSRWERGRNGKEGAESILKGAEPVSTRGVTCAKVSRWGVFVARFDLRFHPHYSVGKVRESDNIYRSSRFQSAEAEEERAPARQVDVRQAVGTGGD